MELLVFGLAINAIIGLGLCWSAYTHWLFVALLIDGCLSLGILIGLLSHDWVKKNLL